MKMLLKLTLVILISTSTIISVATEYPYEIISKRMSITVLGENEGYTTTVMCKGNFLSEKLYRVHIPYSELSTISNLNASYLNEKGKSVKLKSKDFGNSMMHTGSFYSNYRSYFFNLEPANFPYLFEYSYSKSTDLLMLLTLLSFDTGYKTDTLIYEIKVPKNLKLNFRKSGDFSNVEKFDLVESENESYKIYTFSAFNLTPEKQHPVKNRYIHPVKEFARIDLSVVPTGTTDGFDYFNNWYSKLIEPHSKLNNHTLAFIDSLVKDVNDEDEKLNKIFNTVKERIAYIDIENGLGAFQPRDPNEIYLKKQGDCKDMANLLYLSLVYLGYDAHIAISSSLSHYTDITFPNISSANHAICVVKHNNKWIYLDATDPEIKYGMPSRHIQDRNIFIINNQKGELHKVPFVPADKNKFKYKMDLVKVGNGLSGNTHITYEGLSMVEVLSLINRKTNTAAHAAISEDLKSMSKNLQYNNLHINNDEDSIIIKAAVNSEKNFISVANKNYLSLNYLPKPHSLPQLADTTQKIISYKAINNEFDIVIEMGNNVKISEPLTAEYNKMGIEFKFEIQQPASDKIRFIYSCTINHVVLQEQHLIAFNEMNTIINNTFSKSLKYE